MRLLSDGDLLLSNNGIILKFGAGGKLVKTYTPSTDTLSLSLNPDGNSFWKLNICITTSTK